MKLLPESNTTLPQIDQAYHFHSPCCIFQRAFSTYHAHTDACRSFNGTASLLDHRSRAAEGGQHDLAFKLLNPQVATRGALTDSQAHLAQRPQSAPEVSHLPLLPVRPGGIWPASHETCRDPYHGDDGDRLVRPASRRPHPLGTECSEDPRASPSPSAP